MPQPSRRQLVAYVLLALVIGWLGLRVVRAPAGTTGGGRPVATLEAGGTASGAAGSGDGPPVAGDPSGADPTSARAGEAVGGAPAPGAVVVHVAGAVRRPGVVRLRDGSRVADAIERAGGATGRAQLDAVNLAAKLADGQQVLVPRRGALGLAAAAGPAGSVAAGGSAAPPAGPIDLNTATAAQLDELDGVGPATAEKILAWRAANGGFRSVEDLGQVPGIGPKKLAALREQVRV